MIERTKETETLQRAFQSKYPEFVGIYGPLHAGKTFLITEVFTGKFAFQHTGLAPREDDADSIARNVDATTRQLAHFHESLVLQGEEGTEAPQNWGEAFLRMVKLIEKKAL